MFLNPDKLFRQLDFHPEMNVADFGCGSGEFTIPLARMVKKGRVFAVDIQKSPLDVLEGRAQLERLFNIKTIVGDLEAGGTKAISSHSVDYVFIINALFQMENYGHVIDEAFRVLGPEDYLVIVDWSKSIGGSSTISSVEQLKDTIEKAGFSFVKNLDCGHYHFGLLFKKA